MKRNDSLFRVCQGCEQELPVDSFYKKATPRKDGTQGYRSLCKDCYNAKSMGKYFEQQGKEKQKKRSFKALMASYGITEEIYEQERVNQNYCCKLCGAHENSQPHGRLHVDHCHETGLYRGLLCNLCNVGLGAFKDNTDALQKAIGYLNENRNRHREQARPKQDLGSSDNGN
jgi:hypothetical protein